MRFFARIGPRLLLFNLLLVFLPVVGVMSFRTYERQLLALQERSMVQQGRLLALALGGAGELDPSAAQAFLARLGGRVEARLRVVGRDGSVVADSAASGPTRADTALRRSGGETRESPLYRIGAWLGRSFLQEPWAGELAEPVESLGSGLLLGPEVSAALEGRYGAATRVSSGQRSLTLYSALPVRDATRDVVGAVLVSQSTARLLSSLWALRLDLFRVFLASVALAGVLSLLAAGTVSRPLAKLSAEADGLPGGRRRLGGAFAGVRRRDEIGDLARALGRLTRRLDEHLAASEAFAADLAHEFKNPLAAIRAATEMLATAETGEERRRFLSLVEREVARLGRLLSGVQELTRLDSGAESEPRVRLDLAVLLGELLESFRLRLPDLDFSLRTPAGPVAVVAAPSQLMRVFENLLDNATSFSPPGGRIDVTLQQLTGELIATVGDEGPGIPAADRARVFERFFSVRRSVDGGRDEHDGLGLAIARAIVEHHGGTIAVLDTPPPGAVLELRLPLAGG